MVKLLQLTLGRRVGIFQVNGWEELEQRGRQVEISGMGAAGVGAEGVKEPGTPTKSQAARCG